MTGFVSKRQAAQGKLDDDDDTQVYADRKRGSIALARELCVQIAGYTDDDQDQCGHDYGSVDIAEILSAEVVRLQKALAQPVFDCPRCGYCCPEAEPVAWAVQACSKMWRGEFAEIDAKAEAKRIGGTCVAYALYTAPPLPVQPERQPLTDKQILADETLRYYFGQHGGAGPVSKQGRKVVDAIEALHDIKENT